MLDYLYFIIYSATREDNNPAWTRQDRTAYLLEALLGFWILSILLIFLGIIGFRITNFIVGMFIVIPCFVLSYFIVKNLYIKSKGYERALSKYSNELTKRKQLISVILVLFFGIATVAGIIGSGILMSYLLSLHGY